MSEYQPAYDTTAGLWDLVVNAAMSARGVDLRHEADPAMRAAVHQARALLSEACQVLNGAGAAERYLQGFRVWQEAQALRAREEQVARRG